MKTLLSYAEGEVVRHIQNKEHEMTYAEHLKKYVMEECSPQHVEKAV